MQIGSFVYKVGVQLSLTEEDVLLLMEVSDSHYDTACREAGQPGGFLSGWLFCVQEGLEVETDFRQLDLVGKILEQRRFHFDSEETRSKLERSCVLTEEVTMLLRAINAEYKRLNKETE